MMATWEEQELAHNEALDKIEKLEKVVEILKSGTSSLHSAHETLHEAGYTMGGSASERIEQLEAEVESWKNSYEREKREKDDLAVRFEVAQHIPEE